AIPRARGVLRVVVTLRESAHGREAADTHGRDGRFRSAADHRLGGAALDELERVADGVRAGGTGRGGGRIWPARAETNGHLPGREVDNDRRDEKRRDAVRAFFQQDLVLALDDLEPADAAADVDAHAVTPFGRDGQARVGHGEVRSRDSELDEAGGLADVLLFHVPLRVEIFHFTGEARGKAGGIEELDVVDAAAPLADSAPRLFGANANGTKKTNAGDDNSARQEVDRSGYFLAVLASI